MANRWKGNFIVATEATSSGTAYTGKANGSWSLNNQIQQKQANLWAKGVGAPTAPTIVTATAGNTNASVAFTASSDAGASGSLTYTATSTPGSFTNTGSSSPIVVSGLTNGTQYTFKVNATNSLGYVSPDSAASNSTGTTVPDAPTIGTATGANTSASITFTAPANTGGLPITGYTATSSPGSITGTAASSPVTVSGLTNGTTYSFTVVAANDLGNSLSSAATNGVTPSGTALILALDVTPFIAAYSFNNGFTSKYTNPATLPGGTTLRALFNPDGNSVTISCAISPYIYTYAWSGSGFGSQYSNPATLPAGGAGLSFNDSGSLVALCGGTSPNVDIYNWSNGFGTRYANPTTLPATACTQISLSSTAVVMSASATPFIHAYAWSGSGFGSKYANPTSLPTSISGAAKFSPSGAYVAGGQSATPFAYAYAFSSGFTSRYSNPASLPTGAVQSCIMPTNTLIALAHSATPFVAVYPFSAAGFGTKYGNPATTLPSNAFGVSFNSSLSTVAVATNLTPFVNAYTWSNGFGSKFSNPGTLPQGQARDVAFNYL